MPKNCQTCEEEAGLISPAVTTDKEFGPLCEACAKDVGAMRGADRHNAHVMNAALGDY